MKRILSLLILTFVLLTSCANENESARKALLDKVLEVHDQVMPKMGDIMKYKKQLNTKIDELVEAGAEENADQIAQLKTAVTSLENSHEGMMSWMRGFNSNFDDKVEQEVMAYLDDQMTRIEAVAKETDAALQKAEELLSEK